MIWEQWWAWVVFGCALEQGTTGNNIARQAWQGRRIVPADYVRASVTADANRPEPLSVAASIANPATPPSREE